MLQRLRENKSMQGTFLALPTTLWLFVLLIIPLFLTLVVSFGTRSPDGDVIYSFGLHNYIRLFGYSTDCPDGQTSCFDPLYVNILSRSLTLAFNTTVIVIMLAYPLAYFIARSHPNRRNMFLFMVLIPLWTNFVIRVYAWMMLLRKEGAINIILGSVVSGFNVIFAPLAGWAQIHFPEMAGMFHINFVPLELLYTPGAVLVGMVYEFLPFMILPIYTSLEKIDNSLYEAAADLGANAFRTFLRVTLPLSMPGVVAGTILVFIPVMGTFIVSDILGGRQVILVGNLIQRQFLDARDPTFGSAASLILMVMTLIVTYFYTRKFGFGEEIIAA
ncbi:MAG: ABC transporter permease [Anaerolineae bacterium]|jgi:spermidine/putrescine transport system permease protein